MKTAMKTAAAINPSFAIGPYLFRATFNSSYTAEQGTLTVTDSLSRYSLVNGWAVRDANACATNYIDPQMYSQAINNAVGLCQYQRVQANLGTSSGGYMGADVRTNQNPACTLAWNNYYDSYRPTPNTSSGVDIRRYWTAVNYVGVIPTTVELLLVSRNPGAFWFYRVHAGPWNLAWVDDTISAASIRWRWNETGRPISVDEAFIGQLTPATWLGRDNWAVSYKATTVDGDTALMQSNGCVTHNITAATGVTQELSIRRLDDDNRWIVRCDQANSTIKLIERVSGVETQRASAAATWANGTSYRIVVFASTYAIHVWINTTYKVEYLSARNLVTATGVKVSHAGSNLYAWPESVTINIGTPVVQKTIWAVGDSKTVGQGDDTTPYPLGQNGWPQKLIALLGPSWAEHPLRDGRGSYGVNRPGGLSMVSVFDSDISTRYPAPDYVLINLGFNDYPQMNNDQAQWVSDYQKIIDTVHAYFPLARVGLARISSDGGDWSVMDDVAIPAVIADRSWAFLGADERSLTTPDYVDGIHLSPAGYAKEAASWKAAMGL